MFPIYNTTQEVHTEGCWFIQCLNNLEYCLIAWFFLLIKNGV